MDITEIQHASITADNRAALSTHMEKFDSFEAAAVDGMDLKKMTGTPFRMPKSMDGLDDAAKTDFTTQVDTLLGRNFATDVEGLADLDLKLNSKNTGMDENLAASFKQFVIDNKIDKKTAQLIIGFHNAAMGKATDALSAAQSDAQLKADGEHVAAVKACGDALIAHDDYGTKEKLDEQTVLLHRALLNNIGTTKERAEEVSEFLKSGEGSTDPIIRHALLKTYASLAAESSTERDGDGKPIVTAAKSKADAQVEKDIWGEEEQSTP